MKASVKLREGDRPLVRAKIPLTFLGMPIASGMAMGSSRDLAFHLGTLFQSGPSCRITYRPGGAAESPLSLLVKAGLGAWGSPAEAPLVVAAEIKLSGKGRPSFSVQVKPRLGNFGVQKNVVSPPPAIESQVLGSSKENSCGGSAMPRTPDKIPLELFGLDVGSPPSSEGSSIVMVEEMDEDHDQQQQQHRDDSAKISQSVDEQRIEDHPADFLQIKTGQSPVPGFKESGSNWSLVAHSALPLGRHAVARVRWRVKLDADAIKRFQGETDIFSVKKLPVLVVDKLSFKSVEDPTPPPPPPPPPPRIDAAPGLIDPPELGKVAKLCSSMKRELHLLHAENEVLKNTMEEMKAELGGGKRSGKKPPPPPPPPPSYVVDREMQRELMRNHYKHHSDKEYSQQHKTNHHKNRHHDQHQQQQRSSPSTKSTESTKSEGVDELDLLTKQLQFELKNSQRGTDPNPGVGGSFGKPSQSSDSHRRQ